MKKKALSLVLALAMVFTLFSGMAMTASAAIPNPGSSEDGGTPPPPTSETPEASPDVGLGKIVSLNGDIEDRLEKNDNGYTYDGNPMSCYVYDIVDADEIDPNFEQAAAAAIGQYVLKLREGGSAVYSDDAANDFINRYMLIDKDICPKDVICEADGDFAINLNDPAFEDVEGSYYIRIFEVHATSQTSSNYHAMGGKEYLPVVGIGYLYVEVEAPATPTKIVNLGEGETDWVSREGNTITITPKEAGASYFVEVFTRLTHGDVPGYGSGGQVYIINPIMNMVGRDTPTKAEDMYPYNDDPWTPMNAYLTDQLPLTGTSTVTVSELSIVVIVQVDPGLKIENYSSGDTCYAVKGAYAKEVSVEVDEIDLTLDLGDLPAMAVGRALPEEIDEDAIAVSNPLQAMAGAMLVVKVTESNYKTLLSETLIEIAGGVEGKTFAEFIAAAETILSDMMEGPVKLSWANPMFLNPNYRVNADDYYGLSVSVYGDYAQRCTISPTAEITFNSTVIPVGSLNPYVYEGVCNRVDFFYELGQLSAFKDELPQGYSVTTTDYEGGVLVAYPDYAAEGAEVYLYAYTDETHEDRDSTLTSVKVSKTSDPTNSFTVEMSYGSGYFVMPEYDVTVTAVTGGGNEDEPYVITLDASGLENADVQVLFFPSLEDDNYELGLSTKEELISYTLKANTDVAGMLIEAKDGYTFEVPPVVTITVGNSTTTLTGETDYFYIIPEFTGNTVIKVTGAAVAADSGDDDPYVIGLNLDDLANAKAGVYFYDQGVYGNVSAKETLFDASETVELKDNSDSAVVEVYADDGYAFVEAPVVTVNGGNAITAEYDEFEDSYIFKISGFSGNSTIKVTGTAVAPGGGGEDLGDPENLHAIYISLDKAQTFDTLVDGQAPVPPASNLFSVEVQIKDGEYGEVIDASLSAEWVFVTPENNNSLMAGNNVFQPAGSNHTVSQWTESNQSGNFYFIKATITANRNFDESDSISDMMALQNARLVFISQYGSYNGGQEVGYPVYRLDFKDNTITVYFTVYVEQGGGGGNGGNGEKVDSIELEVNWLNMVSIKDSEDDYFELPSNAVSIAPNYFSEKYITWGYYDEEDEEWSKIYDLSDVTPESKVGLFVEAYLRYPNYEFTANPTVTFKDYTIIAKEFDSYYGVGMIVELGTKAEVDAKLGVEPEEPVETYTISGTLMYANSEYGYDNLNVYLMSGQDQIAYNYTYNNGHFEFDDVAPGCYNLVFKTSALNPKTLVTAFVEVTDENVTVDLVYQTNVHSALEIGSGTPDIVVGGLDEEAAEIYETEGVSSVDVKMTVEAKTTTNVDPDEKAAIEEVAASQSENLEYLDVIIEKKVTGGSTPGTFPINKTSGLITIVIPFDTEGKTDFKVYRYHEDEDHTDDVQALTTTANSFGEKIIVGDGQITVLAKYFSTYAIGYSLSSGGGITPPIIPSTPSILIHSCTSVCEICGGCKNDVCIWYVCYNKCTEKENAFTDVAEGQWYTDAVKYVYHRGLMKGIGNDLFDLSGTSTRAQIVMTLWRLEGCPAVPVAEGFNDVFEGDWYYEAIRWASAYDIVGGYGDGNYGPNDTITREQMAAILWRYAKYKGYDVSVGEDTNILSYADAFDIAEYAVPAMQWACGSGVIGGMRNDEGKMILDPKGGTTRAQMAVMLMRFCEDVLKK